MKLWIKILIGVTLLVTVVLVFAGNYFYNYAVVPSEKDFLEGDTPGTTKTNEESSAQSWFANPDNRKEWQQISTDGLKLSAIYLPATDSHKTAIVAHGYMGNAETMANYAKMFHDLGYNVLVPDARGHGKSEGDYIGFGWHERKDYVKWIDQVLETNGQSEEIVLYGISMGAATVMMTSGESLSTNVKAIIEDCGYSSVNEELAYQLNELFSLPPFPLIQVTSLMTKIRAGYFFGEADAIKQLEKNQLPMLFIHGDADTFVPYEMLDKVYQATNGPKEKYIVPGAEHAKAYSIDPENYQKTVSSFLEKYVK
ncbi:alpha/beta hydrolase [Enterococcus mundtii]|uniref:alpha/beta hydrolase n=1 Tax=Enterococcus TaxID=1350 RepID=UPI00129C2FF3|nr:alpha/beta hydrolase [Enterococcus mundtii]MBE9910877.1 alpha/beta hydrolase [Enterococcus mundtii]MRI74591.1 alpha/beta hydrolase [Enterococcus mundtii]GKS54278.1 alpha/beta hydrolase [Enterococcus mundtii]